MVGACWRGRIWLISCDHPVPVEQEVEGHDRRDDEQDQEVEQLERADQHLVQHGQAAVAQHGLGAGEVAHDLRLLAEELGIAAAEELHQPGDVVGHRHDQRLDLLDQRRHQQHQHQDEDEDGADRDDGGGERAAEPEPFQPVGQRVEEVGERRARAGTAAASSRAARARARRSRARCPRTAAALGVDRHRPNPSPSAPPTRDRSPRRGKSVAPGRQAVRIARLPLNKCKWSAAFQRRSSRFPAPFKHRFSRMTISKFQTRRPGIRHWTRSPRRQGITRLSSRMTGFGCSR